MTCEAFVIFYQAPDGGVSYMFDEVYQTLQDAQDAIAQHLYGEHYKAFEPELLRLEQVASDSTEITEYAARHPLLRQTGDFFRVSELSLNWKPE